MNITIELTEQDIEALKKWRREPLHSRVIGTRIIARVQRVLDVAVKNP